MTRATRRVAYVTNPHALKAANGDVSWQLDETFNAANEVLANPALKEVYKTALVKGFAIVNKGT